MNKDLKKYIKENLKINKKRKSIIKVLFSPITFILSFFSRIFKGIFCGQDYDATYLTKKEKIKKNISKKGKVLHKLKGISFYEEQIIELDETIDSKNDTSLDYEIPAFLRNRKDIDINQYIEENNKYNDFQTLLFKMIDERNLIDSDVYNKVHIDRRLFSKIRNDKNYHPSKETIILLGLSMELSEEEIEKLLESASYSLPRNNHYDLIIRFCFMKGIYKITDVNDLLEQYNCKLFNY